MAPTSRKCLTIEEKLKLIDESSEPGFDHKKACQKYGVSNSTITQILKKQKESILSSPISNKSKSMR